MNAAPPSPVIRPLQPSDVAPCARMMAASDPWLTLGRNAAHARKLLRRPDRECHVLEVNGRPAGILVLCLRGALVGYIQAICVAAEHRGGGLGSTLLAFAERRIFREFPNVFLCVSSFNRQARRLYRRRGYRQVGVLRDYVVAGHDEHLLRKSTGPLDRPPASDAAAAASRTQPHSPKRRT